MIALFHMPIYLALRVIPFSLGYDSSWWSLNSNFIHACLFLSHMLYLLAQTHILHTKAHPFSHNIQQFINKLLFKNTKEGWSMEYLLSWVGEYC